MRQRSLAHRGETALIVFGPNDQLVVGCTVDEKAATRNVFSIVGQLSFVKSITKDKATQLFIILVWQATADLHISIVGLTKEITYNAFHARIQSMVNLIDRMRRKTDDVYIFIAQGDVEAVGMVGYLPVGCGSTHGFDDIFPQTRTIFSPLPYCSFCHRP